jgi:Endosomal/lysosomal potassium channel TMEM175
MTKPFTGRRHEVSRLEGFSDAVFGFAVTLLVVSLEVPNLHRTLGLDARFSRVRNLFHPAVPGVVATFQVLPPLRPGGSNDDRADRLLFVVLFYVYPLKFMFGFLVDGLVFGWGREVTCRTVRTSRWSAATTAFG